MELRPILSQLARSKTGPLLVAIQVALSLAILANALYIVNQRLATASRPSGVADEPNVGTLFERPIQALSHNEILARQQQTLRAIAAIPGVESVAWTSQMPMSQSGSNSTVRRAPGAKSDTTPSVYFAQDGFVKTLGLKLVEGRDFNESDIVVKNDAAESWSDSFPKGVIVSRPLAAALFPADTSYAGKTFYFGSEDNAQPVRILGVVEQLQTTGAQPSAAGNYAVILPWRISLPYSRYAIRAQPGQLDRVLGAAEDTVRKISATPTRTFTRTVLKDREIRYRNERAVSWMLVAVSGLLLLVTASGIVGMTSLRVAQRRKQIGVRRALGARWRDIVRYFVTENLVITTGGIAVGVVLTIALNQFLVRQLELGHLPGMYLAIGAGVLWVLGLAAVYGPASRAANIPPAIATRTA